jgi:hypothetical protein
MRSYPYIALGSRFGMPSVQSIIVLAESVARQVESGAALY